MATLDLTCFTSQLLKDSLVLFVLANNRILFLFQLASEAVLLLQALLQVLNPHSERVALFFAQEWLRSHILNRALNVIPRLNSVLHLTLDISHLLRFQL